MDKSKTSILFGFMLVVVLFTAYTIRSSLLIIYISAIFAIVLSPSVDWVCRLKIRNWHPGRGAAILLIVGSVLLAFSLLLLFGLPPLISDIQQLFTVLPEELGKLREKIQHTPVLNHIDENRIKQYSASVIEGIPQLVGSIANGIVSIATIAVLTVYLILEGEQLFRRLLAVVPAEKREKLEPALVKSSEMMRKWLVGQAILMLILGSASVIVFGFLGVRYFYLLGVFAGLANFIPLLGPVITIVVAGLVASLDSWGKLLGVLIFYLVYQQVENAYLTPKIMKSQVELSASAVLISLLIGAQLAGIAGAMMAVPTTVLASVMFDFFVLGRNQQEKKT